MMIAGTAALLYARDLARGYIAGALGGLVIGAACGLAAVGVANLLGDHPDQFLPYGVMICALVGAIGGLVRPVCGLDTRVHRHAAAIASASAQAQLRRLAPEATRRGKLIRFGEKCRLARCRPGKGLGGLLIRAGSQPTDK